MISTLPGEPGLNLMMLNDLALLLPQPLEPATVRLPEVNPLLKVTSTMVSLMPAPPGCAVMLAPAGAVQTYKLAPGIFLILYVAGTPAG